jgi:hypothetical protein
MAQTEWIADGKRHGIAITDYLLERIRDRRLMPAVGGRCRRRDPPQACKRDAGRGNIARRRGHLGPDGPSRVARAGDGGSSPRVNGAGEGVLRLAVTLIACWHRSVAADRNC